MKMNRCRCIGGGAHRKGGSYASAVVLAVVAMSVADRTHAEQEGLLPVQAVNGSRARIVFPVAADLSLERVRVILHIVERIDSTRGLPRSDGQERRLTVSLAWKGRNGIDGWASAKRRLVAAAASG